MKEKTAALLNKSGEAADAADTLLQAGYFDSAASRAYYAMFYAAEALLWEEDFEFGKHGAVHAAFGKHFVQAGRLNAKFHRYLLDSFDLRVLSDYDAVSNVSRFAAEEQIRRAREFLAAASAALGSSK